MRRHDERMSENFPELMKDFCVKNEGTHVI
jgi:hypothetical protein